MPKKILLLTLIGLVLKYAVKRSVDLVNSLGEHVKATHRHSLLILLLLNLHVEVSRLCSAIN